MAQTGLLIYLNEYISDQGDSDDSSDSASVQASTQASTQAPPHTPPEINQKTMTVLTVEHGNILYGYTASNDFIYGYATVSDEDDNNIYYYRSVVIRDDELLLTSNDNYVIIKHTNFIIECVRYVGVVDDTEIFIKFGPNWDITRINKINNDIIFQANEKHCFISSRSRNYTTTVNADFYKKFHNFFEIESLDIAPPFNRIFNNPKYRELYTLANNIKNNVQPHKLENARCIICMNYTPVYALECGHLLYCEHCQSQTQIIKRRRIEYKCPLCNTTHYSLKRIYY